MARIISPSIQIKGKVGPLVFTKWKNVGVLKTVPDMTKKPISKRSAKVKSARKKFGSLSEFLGSLQLNHIFKKGFPVARSSNESALNASTACHLSFISGLENKEHWIAPEELCLSDPNGPLEHAEEINVIARDGGMVTVEWALDPFPERTTRLDDEMVLVFHEFRKVAIRRSVFVERRAGTCSVIFPADLIGRELHCWAFFASANCKLVSPTKYLGTVILI